jgi:ERCC4-related helicase
MTTEKEGTDKKLYCFLYFRRYKSLVNTSTRCHIINIVREVLFVKPTGLGKTLPAECVYTTYLKKKRRVAYLVQ